MAFVYMKVEELEAYKFDLKSL